MKISLKDKTVIEAFAKGNTLGIFQFENPNIKDFLKAFVPEHFSDLVFVNAMNHPGLIYHIPDVIKSKKTKKIINDFSGCEFLLKETYGIPVYQNQITQMIQTLAKYSPEESELLLNVMKSKKVEKLIINKQEFAKRTSQKGFLTEIQANVIFEIL